MDQKSTFIETIRKFPDEKPVHCETCFVCNHFYDHWWFGHYNANTECFEILDRSAEDFEQINLVTRWIPVKRPCLMFDQEEGSIYHYICPKCKREYKDCKNFNCNKDDINV